jgi:uncharacterized protein (TIGR03437 family)
LFGRGLSESSLQAGAGALPNQLGSTVVLVNDQPAPLLFISPGQINLQLPNEVSGATASIVVRVGAIPTPPVAVPIASVSPSIFTLTGSGAGPGAIVKQNGTVVSRTNPVKPLEIVSVYATGLGAVSPKVATGAVSPPGPALAYAAGSVSVWMEGRTAPVLFAGLSPSFVGLFQINVQVPLGITGAYPAVALAVNGIVSPEVSAGGPGLIDLQPASVATGSDATITLRGFNLSPASVLEISGERIAGSLTSGDLDQFRVVVPKRLLNSAGVLACSLLSTEGRSNRVELTVGQP